MLICLLPCSNKQPDLDFNRMCERVQSYSTVRTTGLIVFLAPDGLALPLTSSASRAAAGGPPGERQKTNRRPAECWKPNKLWFYRTFKSKDERVILAALAWNLPQPDQWNLDFLSVRFKKDAIRVHTWLCLLYLLWLSPAIVLQASANISCLLSLWSVTTELIKQLWNWTLELMLATIFTAQDSFWCLDLLHNHHTSLSKHSWRFFHIWYCQSPWVILKIL